jgi:DNA-binding transcriptional regulator YhcF (GntR family)
MDIKIDSSNDVPIRRQLTEQIIYLIAIDRLKDGELMPSVRELARRLKIHHNTVSEAYQDLVRREWLERHRGSRLAVISRERSRDGSSLDDLINQTIAVARENGHTLQSLRERVRERLLAQPPDHILVVEQDEGLRELIIEELRTQLRWPVEGCTREGLAANSGLAIGALAVAPQHAVRRVSPLFPKERPVVAARYSHADEHLRSIRGLRGPSVIAVVSGSRLFLDVARSVLAPALGNRHELREILIPDESPATAKSADLVFCDSIAKKSIRLPKTIHYKLVMQESIDYIATSMRQG